MLSLQPRLAALEPQLGREAPRALPSLRRLRPLALAAWLAHARARAVVTSDEVTPLATEAFEWRARLLAAVDALVAFGCLDARQVAPFRAGPARDRRGAADTLLGLADLLEQRWERVEGSTPLKRPDLDRARVVALALVEALGAAPAVDAVEAATLRTATWTLLFDHYEEVRRAVAWLRWRDGDADTLAPPLGALRRPARPSAPTTAQPPTDPAPPPAVSPPPTPLPQTDDADVG